MGLIEKVEFKSLGIMLDLTRHNHTFARGFELITVNLVIDRLLNSTVGLDWLCMGTKEQSGKKCGSVPGMKSVVKP